jgi:hypothetical protein
VHRTLDVPIDRGARLTFVVDGVRSQHREVPRRLREVAFVRDADQVGTRADGE